MCAHACVWVGVDVGVGVNDGEGELISRWVASMRWMDV